MEFFKISTALKRKAVEDISTRPSKLFHVAAEILDTQNLDKSDIKAIKNQYMDAEKKFSLFCQKINIF